MIVETVGDRAGERVVFLHVGAEEEHRHGAKDFAGQEHCLHPHLVAVDRHREADAGVLQEGVLLFPELDRQLTVFAAGLVIIAVGPINTDTAEVLSLVGGGTHVRTGEETEAARVDLETLVDRKFAGEIDSGLRILRRNLVAVGERLGQETGGRALCRSALFMAAF